MNKQTLLALVSVATLAMVATAADSNAPAKPPTLEWLVGHWCADRDGDFIEEQWLSVRGDVMLGLSRTVHGAKTRNFEYLRVVLENGEVTYIAQPQGEPPVAFKRAAGGEDWARFENPAHDFPKRVEYRRTAKGLRAEIAGPGADGREMSIPFDYLPCPGR